MAIHDGLLFRDVATGGFKEGVICLATIAIVEKGNDSELVDALDRNGAGYAAAMLRNGALFRMHMYVVCAFDPVRDRYPDDINLRAAIEFAEQHPDRLHWRSTTTDRLLNQACALYREIEQKPELNTLKTIRNKAMAHRGIIEPSVEFPLYGELFQFTRDVCRVWELVALGAGITTKPMSESVSPHVESAEKLWKLLRVTEI